MTQQTLMAREARETPAIIQRQLDENGAIFATLADKIRAFSPSFVYMIGRGTSDHAGVFGKYLIEVELGVPVCHAAPSVSSVFKQSLSLDKALVIVISQSGRSPDILAQVAMAKEAGALTVAFVNDESSPLATDVDVFVPVKAGPEIAVAATKSYLATLASLATMVAYWKQDNMLKQSIEALPQALNSVIAGEAQLTTASLAGVAHCIVLGRSFGYAIAREVALKMKEVCGIQAEAFSSAEFLHGPISLLNRGVMSVDLSIPDETKTHHQGQIDEIQRRGGQVVKMAFDDVVMSPRLIPLLIMQRFYLDIEQIAVEMGLDPDSPQGLKKVTETV